MAFQNADAIIIKHRAPADIPFQKHSIDATINAPVPHFIPSGSATIRKISVIRDAFTSCAARTEVPGYLKRKEWAFEGIIMDGMGYWMFP